MSRIVHARSRPARYIALVLLTVGASLATVPAGVGIAQTVALEAALPLESLRGLVVRAISATDDTGEISRADGVLVLTRVNSTMAKATHEGLANEASAIAKALSDEITGHAEFADLVAIRVRYLTRHPDGSASSAVDSIEFRRAPDGHFDLHLT